MYSSSFVGKARRLAKIFAQSDQRAVIVPVDDSLINGPTGGLEHMRPKIAEICEFAPDALLAFWGTFQNFSANCLHVPSIMNLTASSVRSQHTRKIQVMSVDAAVGLGMDAVAVHVNVGSRYEPQMLEILGQIAEKCSVRGMPLMAIMYPRSEGEHGDNNYYDLRHDDPPRYAELVAHAARIGVELGADIIKTQYTGSKDTFEVVVAACDPVPVVVAGGPVLPDVEMFTMARSVIDAGGAGISFGRNVFSRPHPGPYIAALKRIVHNSASVEEVTEGLAVDILAMSAT